MLLLACSISDKYYLNVSVIQYLCRVLVKEGMAKSGGTFWNVRQNTGNTDQLPKIRFQLSW